MSIVFNATDPPSCVEGPHVLNIFAFTLTSLVVLLIIYVAGLFLLKSISHIRNRTKDDFSAREHWRDFWIFNKKEGILLAQSISLLGLASCFIAYAPNTVIGDAAPNFLVILVFILSFPLYSACIREMDSFEKSKR